MPLIEIATCNPFTGAGCTLIPQTDDGTPAVFYPFFSIERRAGGCTWMEGDHIPGSSNDFGQNAGYRILLNLPFTYLGGAPLTIYFDFPITRARREVASEFHHEREGVPLSHVPSAQYSVHDDLGETRANDKAGLF